MAPVTLVGTPIANGAKVFKKEEMPYSVISFPDSGAGDLPQDIINEFFNLAKGLKKHIVLIDWTCDNPDKCFMDYKNNPEYYLVFLVNGKKDSKGDGYYTNLSFDKNTIVDEVLLLDKQFRSYPDEWELFKIVSMAKIYDIAGLFYGDAVQEYARLFVDLQSTDIFKRKLVLGAFISSLVKDIKKYPSIAGLEVNRMVEQFKSFLTTVQENTKSRLKYQIKEFQSEMTSHYTAIQRLEKSISDSNAIFRSITRRLSSTNADTSQTKLLEVFESFRKNKMYTSLLCGDGVMEAITDEIWCESYGKKYYVGKFKVTIELNGKVKMTNLVRRPDGDYDHPHISASIPCLGNIKEIVPKMIFNGDFIGLLNLLHQFLITYNEAGPYIALEVGWGKPEDWCHKCEHPTLACSCKNCAECGEDEEHCTCDRCPRYGELMENTDCSGCDYWKREGPEDEDGDPVGDHRCTY